MTRWTRETVERGPVPITRRMAIAGGLSAALAAAVTASRAASLPMAEDVARLAATAQDTVVKARALATRFTDRRDVRTFGVTGRGADELAALQHAVDAAAGKAVLVIPAGLTILIGGMLTIPADCHLHIDGMIKLLPVEAASAVIALQVSGSNVAITGAGTLDGSHANQNSKGLSGGIGTDVTRNVSLVYVQGITVQNFKNWPVNLVVCADCLVENTILRESGNSCEYSHAKNCHFLNNYVSNVSDAGIGLYGFCHDCTVVGNFIEGCVSGPFVMSDKDQPGACSNSILANNITLNPTIWGGYMSSFDNINDVHSQIVVVGNISYHTHANTVKNASGFAVSGASSCVIANNVNIGPPSKAIYFGMPLQNTLTDVTVRGNYISNANTSGVVVLDNALSPKNHNVVIEDNFIVGGRSGFGIRLVVKDSSAFTIRNNIITGTVAGHPYLDDGGQATFVAAREADAAERFAPPPVFPAISGGIAVQRAPARAIAIPAGLVCWIWNPEHPADSLAVTLPAKPAPGQTLTLIFEQPVTALTLAAPAGQTLAEPPAKTIEARTLMTYICLGTTWHRVRVAKLNEG